jgi:HD-GYP domain-containing protein (c-di-GMP phosphodiesterase class II)
MYMADLKKPRYTKSHEANHKLQRLNSALMALSRINKALLAAKDEKLFLQEVCRIIVQTRSYPLAWVGYPLINKAKSVIPVAQAGFKMNYLDKLKISWGDNKWGRGPTGIAIRTGKMQVVTNIMTDPKYKPWRAMGKECGFQGSITFPLKYNHTFFGAIMIYTDKPDAFSADEIKLLEELVSDIAFGINTIRTRQELFHSEKKLAHILLKTLEVAVYAVEKRDPYTAGHMQRTASLARAIAFEMSLPAEQISGIIYGAMVHDIGKIYVPAEILARPSKLTPLEMEFIRTHPQMGYDLIKGIEYPWPIAEIILQHHERLDGSGYPHGLKGNQILLETRVITVADVVEAMMSHRPYRPAHTLNETLREIRSNKGKLYDPDVVNTCIRLLKKKDIHEILSQTVEII